VTPFWQWLAVAALAVTLVGCITLGVRAARGMTHRELEDACGWSPEALARLDQDRNRVLATDQFEARTHCPSCGAYELHAMRWPKPAPSAAEVEAWEVRRREFFEDKRGEIARATERIDIMSFGYINPIRTITNAPTFREPKPDASEAEYTTIRICECGHEWGQK
jgi:hypothetical protein